MTDPLAGIQSDPTLLAAGWERRYLADPDRAKEALETYAALGFEVLAQPLVPAQFPSSCGDCSSAVCRSYVLVYTRKRGGEPVAPPDDARVAPPPAAARPRVLQPPAWPRPKGYANGVVARGAWICVAGQVGWNEQEQFVETELVGQTRQALENIVAVLAEAGAGPEHVVRLTWYVTDKQAYLGAQEELGRVYRAVFGRHFPAMSLVVVAGLVEEGALVEIEATAALPEAVA